LGPKAWRLTTVLHGLRIPQPEIESGVKDDGEIAADWEQREYFDFF